MRIYRSNSIFVNKTGFLVKKYSSNSATYSHSHDFIELVYVFEGTGVHTIDGKEYSIVKGSFFSVNAGQTHSLLFLENAEYYNIFLTKAFLKKFVISEETGITAYDLIKSRRQSPAMYLSPENTILFEMIFHEIFNEFSLNNENSSEILNTYFKLLLLKLSKENSRVEATDAKHRPHLALPKVLDYINAHFTEPIRLNTLAEKYSYNSAYFGRLFRKCYGMSFDEYIKIRRIDYAKELLITTTHSIDTVMQEVGYTNKNNFYRVFLEQCGCTPKEYRKTESTVDNILALDK